MIPADSVERLFETLVSGNRRAARTLMAEHRGGGLTAEQAVEQLLWPAYEYIEKLYRNDQLSTLAHRMSSRLLRVLVNQNASQFILAPFGGRTALVVSGPGEPDEMAGQMACDLLEAGGIDVAFAGGGIPTDELVSRINQEQPDVLICFASAPSDLPEIRGLIDTLHEIGACPDLQIAVGGGVFNRAEGLAEEIGADLWAIDPFELVEIVVEEPEMRATPDQRTVGRKRKAA